MADASEISPEMRRKQNRDFMEKRCVSWGMEIDEVIDYARQRMAEIFELPELPAAEDVLDAGDVLGSIISPTRSLLEAVKQARITDDSQLQLEVSHDGN